MTKLDYLLKQYETVLGWYKQSEEKASFLMTLNTLVVGVVNGLVFIGADNIRTVRFSTPGPSGYCSHYPAWRWSALFFSYFVRCGRDITQLITRCSTASGSGFLATSPR